MKPPRQFRPLAPVPLEDRIALSHLAAAAATHHTAGSHSSTPAQVQAAGSNTSFPTDIAATIAAGLPVYESTTTRFNNGTTQTGTTLIEPNNTNQSTQTISVNNLPNNGGSETVNEFSYVALTGNTVEVTTTFLPDGSQQIQNETLQAEGNTTLIDGELKDASGISMISGSSTVHGQVTITNKTITDPTGQVTKDHVVTVDQGELRQTVTDTTTNPDGTRKVTRSTETIVRLPLPSTLVQAPSAGSSTPTIG